MKAQEGQQGLNPESMASATMIRAAKKELRTLMKHKLSMISPESIKHQSEHKFIVRHMFQIANEQQAQLSLRISLNLSHIKKQNELGFTCQCQLVKFKQMP